MRPFLTLALAAMFVAISGCKDRVDSTAAAVSPRAEIGRLVVETVESAIEADPDAQGVSFVLGDSALSGLPIDERERYRQRLHLSENVLTDKQVTIETNEGGDSVWPLPYQYSDKREISRASAVSAAIGVLVRDGLRPPFVIEECSVVKGGYLVRVVPLPITTAGALIVEVTSFGGSLTIKVQRTI